MSKVIQYLVIHHSLTKDGKVVDWDAIRRYHMTDPGHKWVDIGYHYGVELVGNEYVIKVGRPEWAVGAQCKEEGMNNKSLGICVVGNYDLGAPPEEAMEQLVILCGNLCSKYKLPVSSIVTHHQFAGYKTCPGTKFPMDELRRRVAERLKGK
jgi:N-acetyl-anhydromuramyl-L-alanine amidase AmpD